jgi:hypothetical protein
MVFVAVAIGVLSGLLAPRGSMRATDGTLVLAGIIEYVPDQVMGQYFWVYGQF